MLIRLCSLLLAMTFSSSASAVMLIDLTSLNSSGEANGAIFLQFTEAGAGGGALESFLTYSKSNTGLTSGVNKAGNPFQFDTSPGAGNTSELRLSEVPIVSIGGQDFREFAFDVNEKDTNADVAKLSLQELEISIADDGDLGPYMLGTSLGGSPFGGSSSKLIYSLDQGPDGDSRVDLTQDLSGPGQGKIDMILYVRSSLFSDPNFGVDPFVYFYSVSGANSTSPGNASIGWTNDNNSEQWGVGKDGPINPNPPGGVPEPSTLAVFGLGAVCIVAGGLRRRRKPVAC